MAPFNYVPWYNNSLAYSSEDAQNIDKIFVLFKNGIVS